MAGTPNGTLWVRTADGLLTFNGKSFKFGDTVLCPDVKRLSVLEDGTLVACTELTLSLQNPTGTWRNTIGETLNDVAVLDALVDDNYATVILSETGVGLLVDRQFEADLNGYPSQPACRVLHDPGGLVWGFGDGNTFPDIPEGLPPPTARQRGQRRRFLVQQRRHRRHFVRPLQTLSRPRDHRVDRDTRYRRRKRMSHEGHHAGPSEPLR